MTALRPKRRSHRHLGQAMVEYLIIFPALLMLVLGAIQFALLYQIKSTLNYATFMAARQGALKNAKSTSIQDALAAGMTPLFTFSPDLSGLARGRAIAAIEAFNPMTTNVAILSPTTNTADDFGVPDPADSNKRLVPNDNLQYRDATVLGAKTGLNIQDANLLKIRVTYCAKLIVPVVNVMIYSLVNGITGTVVGTGEFFGDAAVSKTATTPNMCSQLKDKYGEKVNSIVEAASNFAGIDASFLNSTLNDISSFVSGFTVPGLDWSIGGYRIPVTAEAVMRMQSPARFNK